MAGDRIDLVGLAERAEAAASDLREQVQDAKRRGLEALIALGASAQEALDGMNAGGDVTPEEGPPQATQLPS
jgi:hypothetical protein